MARLQVSLIRPGCAQGRYVLRAKGFFLAVLRWGSAEGPLAGWGPFAHVPVDPAGNGAFACTGMRGIPPEATHVWARCVSHDFATMEDISAEIPPRFLPAEPSGGAARFSLLADIHLSAKPWQIRQALRATRSDVVLLLGDSTNDGLPDQFALLEACIDEAAGDRIVLPVPGNHDVTHPNSASGDGCAAYAAFQERCLARAEARGMAFDRDPDSLAWAARLGGVDLIGLQCVISGRKFLFPEGRQLDWLEARLAAHGDACWHTILCHAPLLAHNPNRSDAQPYLDKNRRLQSIVDAAGRCAFLSGHTHSSPSRLKGGADWDRERRNLYLNCGSVVVTAIEGEPGLLAADWKDGCVAELGLGRDGAEVVTASARTGVRFPRGYYRFDTDVQSLMTGALPLRGSRE